MTIESWRACAEDYKDLRRQVEIASNGSLEGWIDYYIINNACKGSYNTTQHRQFRRLVIREALRRGLITSDPGDAP